MLVFIGVGRFRILGVGVAKEQRGGGGVKFPAVVADSHGSLQLLTVTTNCTQ